MSSRPNRKILVSFVLSYFGLNRKSAEGREKERELERERDYRVVCQLDWVFFMIAKVLSCEMLFEEGSRRGVQKRVFCYFSFTFRL